MLQNSVLFFVGLVFVYTCYGESDEDFPHHFNFPKMVNRIHSRINTFQDLKDANSDLDIPSILKQFKDLGSDEAYETFLRDLAANKDSSKCTVDIQYLLLRLKEKDVTILKMLDAFGKPESGILDGNIKWLGNYHECTNLYVPLSVNGTAGDFNGQYCTLGLSIEALNKTIPLTLGVCLPESCNSIIPAKGGFPQMGSSVNVTSKICQPTSKKLTSSAIAMICLLSLFVFPVLVGSSMTAFEYFFQRTDEEDHYCRFREQINDGQVENQSLDSSSMILKEDNGGWYGTLKSFFNCFCVFTNGEKLLNTDGTEGQLLCLHGIRFLSMTWVIVGHHYLMVLNSVSNIMEAIGLIDTWLFQIVLNGFYSVDSFFLLSGFLLSHLYFQQCAKDGKMSWIYFYVHRFVRLTPVYMIVLGFWAALTYYLGSGPFWQTNEVDPVCADNWFYNLLYINNFPPQKDQCMAWSWYLANDMQYFVISPIILITLWRWPPIGYSVLGIFMSATVAANLGITYHYSLQSGYEKIAATAPDILALAAQQNTFFEQIYVRPYTRMSPYLVGIALAYYMFKRKQNKQGKLHWIILVCGWIVAATISLACLFCLYHRRLSVLESAFYNALSHASFTIGLGWVIFTCLNGQAGPVNSILSFKLFIPLSRLTYCAYLIHPLVLTAYFGSLKVTLNFTHFTMVTTYLGMLVITYACSFIVSVLFESPVIRLEKLIRTKLMS